NFLSEIRDEGRDSLSIFNDYFNDWQNWPGDKGAPFEDINNNGVYEPEIDIPGIKGADQTIWFVANDRDSTLTINLYGSEPLGLEMQATIWGYNVSGPVGSTLFRRFKVTNKSDQSFQEMFIGYWSDPDLGGAGDDFIGCDTSLSLGFAYNGNDYDAQYGYQTPAVGLQLVETNFYDQFSFKSKSSNLFKANSEQPKISSHIFFIGGDPVYSDPVLGEYIQGSITMYKYLRGLPYYDYENFIDPTTGKSTKYCLSGDPLNKEGWIDGLVHSPGDRRQIISVGPLEVKQGESAELTFAISAIQKSANLKAVEALKSFAEYLRESYKNSEFVNTPEIILPEIPEFSIERGDGEFIIKIDNLSKINQSIESFDRDGVKFQGYKIYQYAYEDFYSSIYEAEYPKILIKTIDLKDGITNINGQVYNWEEHSYSENQLLHSGTDSGILREVTIPIDYLESKNFINGRSYEYGVTAYVYSESGKYNSEIETQSTKKHIVYLDNNHNSRFRDLIEVEHLTGNGNGSVRIFVDDPANLKSENYQISVQVSEEKREWVLKYLPSLNLAADPQNKWNNEEIFRVDGLLININSEAGLNYVTEYDQNDEVVDYRVGMLILSDSASSGYVILSENFSQFYFNTDTNIYDMHNYWGRDDVIINFNDSSLVWDYKKEQILKDNLSNQSSRMPFAVYRIDYESGVKYRLFVAIQDSDNDGKWSVDSNSQRTGEFVIPTYEPIYAYQSYNADGVPISYEPDNEFAYQAQNDLFTSANSAFGRTVGEFEYPFVSGILFGLPTPEAKLPIGNKIIFATRKPFSEEDVFEFSTKEHYGRPENPFEESFLLLQNFPNPFNPNTTIKFYVDNDSDVKISVYDILGQRISIVFENFVKRGTHYKEFFGANLSSGVYFYTLEANGQLMDVKKMMLLK
ncbi:MAG: T9SS type A sorting domain-containing protein, partial [Melioribacteraceae bacterium]|nr:T9SS type A sorting domain-containing protein [Melioribacteraceae bacterium]